MSIPRNSFSVYRAVVHSTNPATGAVRVLIPSFFGETQTVSVSTEGLTENAGVYNVPPTGSTVFVLANEDLSQIYWPTGGDGGASDVAADLADHISAPDPHPQYLNQTDGDARYLKLSGGTLTGATSISVAPTLDDHLVRKIDLDNAAGPGSHNHDAAYVNVAGDTMTGVLNMSNNKIAGLAAATASGDAVRYDQLTALGSTYLPLAGGTLTGAAYGTLFEAVGSGEVLRAVQSGGGTSAFVSTTGDGDLGFIASGNGTGRRFAILSDDASNSGYSMGIWHYNAGTTSPREVLHTERTRADINVRTTITSDDAGFTALTVKGAVSQGEDLQRWVNSSSTTLAGVDEFGNVFSILAPTDPSHLTRKSYVDSLVGGYVTISAADAAYVNVSGDTMTGHLLGITPTLDAHLTRKDYVDTADNLRVLKAGDTLTGHLLGITPTLAAHLTRKDYVDGVMTTHLAAGDPHPQYLTPAEGDTAYVNITGDSMTGDLSVTTASATQLNIVSNYATGSIWAKPFVLTRPTAGNGDKVQFAFGKALTTNQMAEYTFHNFTDANLNYVTMGLYGLPEIIKMTNADVSFPSTTVTVPNATADGHALNRITADGRYVNTSGDTMTGTLSLPSVTGTSSGALNVTNNLAVAGNFVLTGNLTVNGTTTTVNSTVVSVDDPIFTLGGDVDPVSDDSKDRGIEFRWHNGTTAKVGFFGFDDSTGKFTFIPDALNTSEVFSGTPGEIVASLDFSNVLNWTATLDTRYINTSGDTLTGHLLGITPTLDAHLARKDYVDGVGASALSALNTHVTAVGAHAATKISYDGSLLSPTSQIWHPASINNVQDSLTTIIAEIDGRIEAGDTTAIINAINNWNVGEPTLSNSGVFEANVIVTQALASGAVVASKIAANTITAAQIAAGTITGTELSATTSITIGTGTDKVSIVGTALDSTTVIRSGGATGYNVGTGFWLDASGRMFIGTAAGNKMTYTGGVLTVTGTVNAGGGSIGGWTLGATTITGGNMVLTNTGNIAAGTANDIVRVSADDATYRLWAGHATAASAPFSVTKAGVLAATGATISGTVTATAGTIGGWTLAPTTLTGTNMVLTNTGNLAAGTANNIVRLSADDATYRLWAGNATAASAPFRVTAAGALTATGATISGTLTATAGTIGGWTLGTTTLTGGNMVLTSTGNLSAGTANDIARISADDATYRLWVGNATAASAPFFVTKTGALTATSATITGAVTATSGAIGGITLAATKMYVGTGTFNNANTAFYVDNAGQFSLKDQLSWNGTTLTLGGTNASAIGTMLANRGKIVENFSEGTAGFSLSSGASVVTDGTSEIGGSYVRLERDINIYPGVDFPTPLLLDRTYKCTMTARVPSGVGNQLFYTRTNMGSFPNHYWVATTFNIIDNGGEWAVYTWTFTLSAAAARAVALLDYTVPTSVWLQHAGDTTPGSDIEIDAFIFEEMSDIFTAGTTTIAGGNITTGSISATQIAANTITGNELNATTNITVGTGTYKVKAIGGAGTATYLGITSAATPAYNNANTPFYAGADQQVSIGDKLTFSGGNLTITGGGTFSGDISAAVGTFTGGVTTSALTASGGTIAGWTIGPNSISKGTTSLSSIGANGSITAQSGVIGGWILNPGNLSSDNGLILDSDNDRVTAGSGTYVARVQGGAGTAPHLAIFAPASAVGGVPNYKEKATPFFASASGQVSIGQRLYYSDSNEVLTVEGIINATAGTFTNNVLVGTGANQIRIRGGSSASDTNISSGDNIYNTPGTGFYLGANGYFSLGQKLTWNGSTLGLTGDVSATSFSLVTANKVVAQLYSSDSSYERLRLNVADSGSFAGKYWDIGWSAGDVLARYENLDTDYITYSDMDTAVGTYANQTALLSSNPLTASLFIKPNLVDNPLNPSAVGMGLAMTYNINGVDYNVDLTGVAQAGAPGPTKLYMQEASGVGKAGLDVDGVNVFEATDTVVDFNVHVTGAGGYTFVQDTQPTAKGVGDTWYDTSTGDSYVWFDSFWVQTSPGGAGGSGSDGYSFIIDTTPTGTANGQTWFNTSNGQSFVWYDGYWVQTAPGGGGGGQSPVWQMNSHPGTGTYAADADYLYTTTVNGSVGSSLITGGKVTVPSDGIYSISAWVSFAPGGTTGQTGIMLAWTAGGNPVANYRLASAATYDTGYGASNATWTGWLPAGAVVTPRVLNTSGANRTPNWGSSYAHTLSVVQHPSGLGPGGLTATPWTALPTYGAQWSNYGGGWQVGQYRKIGDIVELRGLLSRGSSAPSSTICTLPVGFRPPSGLIFPCMGYTLGNNWPIRIDALASGSLSLDITNTYGGTAIGTSAIGYVDISTIKFSVTP